VGYSGDHIRGGSYHGGEEGAFFSQEFVLGRKLALRRDIYLAEGRSNEFNLAMQRARVHNDVGHAFFDALAAQEAVVLHDRLLKVALDSETNAHELERVGQADASDVLGAEIAAEQAKVEFESAQRMFLARFTQLATDAGQMSLDAHPLAGSLVHPPDMDAEGVVANDVQQSPYVKRAQADAALAEARVRDAKRERVPNVTVKAGEWYSGEDLGSSDIKAGWESFAEVGVLLPLWNHNQGNIQAAKIDLERAHQDVVRTRLWTRNRAEPVAQEYMTARDTAERYRTAMIPRARRAYQLEVMKYQQMAQAYPRVLLAQQMLFTLQLAYVDALNEEWRAAIALQNYLLMDGLNEPMNTGRDSTTLNLPTERNSQ
jgi:cobalt-zinc-cadmium efflux system outer membrane protein